LKLHVAGNQDRETKAEITVDGSVVGKTKSRNVSRPCPGRHERLQEIVSDLIRPNAKAMKMIAGLTRRELKFALRNRPQPVRGKG